MLDLSIVIVNWNTRDLLHACLQSLPASVGDLTFEVLIVGQRLHRRVGRDGRP